MSARQSINQFSPFGGVSNDENLGNAPFITLASPTTLLCFADLPVKNNSRRQSRARSVLNRSKERNRSAGRPPARSSKQLQPRIWVLGR